VKKDDVVGLATTMMLKLRDEVEATNGPKAYKDRALETLAKAEDLIASALKDVLWMKGTYPQK
jgi:hypothetical protein